MGLWLMSLNILSFTPAEAIESSLPVLSGSLLSSSRSWAAMTAKGAKESKKAKLKKVERFKMESPDCFAAEISLRSAARASAFQTAAAHEEYPPNEVASQMPQGLLSELEL